MALEAIMAALDAKIGSAEPRKPRRCPWPRKMTAAKVQELRERAAMGESHAALAEAFRISPSYVAAIVSRARFPNDGDGPRSIRKILAPDQVREIRTRVANGELHRNVAAAFGISTGYVGAIVAFKYWAEAGGPRRGEKT